MPPTTLSITVTATVTPPLGPDQTHRVGAELARNLNGQLVMASSDDRGWHSWHVSRERDREDLVSLLQDAEHWTYAAVCGEHGDAGVTEDAVTYRVEALEVLTMAEVERRLTAHGVPGPGQVRPSGPPPEIPRMPDVVTTEQFAREVLDPPVDTSRVRQLRAEAEQARAEGREHPFPAEYLPGFWLREDAERYDREGRRGPGRPRKAPE